MDPRPLTWTLVLLGPVLAPALRPEADPEASPEKLCGAHFVRALVRVCGGPRWSPEARWPAARSNGELLNWLEGQHLSHGLVANKDLELVPGPQPLHPVSRHHHRRRRAAANNPAQRCCLSGCTHQNLLTLCPH
ncbi:insulin-like 3 [Elephas maximus indicus]|uniref:insulin-like 3 n=1 Tax=Elephas maximus indicus TaxID=99487 RepID=UPI002115CEDA|nr:insulin-like 3 [Elephas maximus indicus]